MGLIANCKKTVLLFSRVSVILKSQDRATFLVQGSSQRNVLMSDQAIVFLTHVQSDRVFNHFRRLRDETNGLLSALLCIHDTTQLQPFGQRALAKFQRSAKNIPAPYIVIDVESGARVLPIRFAQMQRRGAWYNAGFLDLCYVPAFLSEQLLHYKYVWFVENDVDYAGNWRDFFLCTMGSSADLLGAYLYARQLGDEWYHWSWFQTPQEVSFNHHTSSLLCIARFSRRLVSLYVDAVRNDQWQGHPEALFPTIARHHGLTISDFGWGAFCPEQWRDKNYRLGPHGTDGTFNDAPTVQTAYFHEEPLRFLERNVLYHPVKAGWTKTRRQPLHSAFALHFRRLKAAVRF
jgi:hypothetical protein